MSSFLVTSFANHFAIFVVGMVILTFGEMFVWPAVPTIKSTCTSWKARAIPRIC